MDFVTILFWISFVIVFWFGFRNIIVIITSSSQMGLLKPGQRLCHGISLLIYWAACLFALLYHSFLPLAIGVVIEQVFRRSIIRSGDKVYSRELDMLLAVRTDNINELKNLIEQSANINFQDSRMEGVTALHEASRKGNIEMVRYLLQNGSNIQLQNYNGLSALHVAAYSGENEIVHALIAAGADVNAQAKDNVTPLHAAASMGHADTVELLVYSGAKVHAKTSKDAETPEDFATREGYLDVSKLLSGY